MQSRERCAKALQNIDLCFMGTIDSFCNMILSEHPFDAIICVANWPQSRQAVWDVLTRARAIENQCYLVGVNRVGNDDYSHYLGQSRIVDGRGNVLCQCADDAEQVVTFCLDLSALESSRQRFRVLDDADPFTL